MSAMTDEQIDEIVMALPRNERHPMRVRLVAQQEAAMAEQGSAPYTPEELEAHLQRMWERGAKAWAGHKTEGELAKEAEERGVACVTCGQPVEATEGLWATLDKLAASVPPEAWAAAEATEARDAALKAARDPLSEERVRELANRSISDRASGTHWIFTQDELQAFAARVRAE